MLCNCSKVNNLITPGTNVIIGTIADVNTAVYIYTQNTTTKRIERQAVTSDGAGAVVLDMQSPDPYFYQANVEFNIWITLASAANMYVTEEITIDTIEYDCLLVEFERVVAGDNIYIEETDQTITV